MKLVRLGLILAVLLFAQLSLVYAQDDEGEITYGQSVAGEITNRDFEVEYNFTGAEGDVVVIQMTPEDARDGLSRPSIILLDNDFQVLDTVIANRDAATLIYMLPYDGQYFIVATRNDGRGGDTVGPYTLLIDLVPELIPDTPMEGSVTNETTSLYAIKSSVAFDLIYQRLAGDFYPEISVQQIESSSSGSTNLLPVMVAQGRQLGRAALGLLEVESDIYIVVVTRALFTFSPGETTADYRLTLRIQE